MLFQQSINKIKIIKICIYLIVLALIFKVGYIQIIDRKNIYDKALESWQRSFPVQANRGKIYDRSGNVLATDLTTASLVVVPSQIKDQATTALKLSEILNVNVDVLKEKLNKKVSIQRISPEGRQLDNQIATNIQRLHLSGVYLIKDTKRYYPRNNYLSHCLGFVGIDNQGLLGLELEYEQFLKGKNGSIDYYMDAKSHNLKMYPSHYTYSQSGMNISLTIHKDVQDVIERELSNAYDTYQPDGIWALAMNPKNGEILGIASYPNFNPNDYQNEDKNIYNQNIPIWKTYEPGSTFKIITFSSALNEKLFDMDKDTYYDKGYEYVSGAKIKSWKKGGHGLQTFREVLQNSSNPGFVEIGRRLGKKRLYQYVQNFGLTEKTGIDLPGESCGIMFDYKNFHELEQATVAFGQGISVTPLQLVTAICACVNGGYLLQPHILKEISNSSNNEIVKEVKKKVKRQVIDEETSRKVRDALESVVTDGGGRNAYIDGYRIGGKTGTAQKAVNGSYVGGGYILSFVGIAPIDDPQIVLYIAMDNPKNCIQYGGTTVAPIARKMFLDILPALNVKKVKSQRQKAYSIMDKRSIKVENYIGKKRSEVQNISLRFTFVGKGTKVIDQLPRKGEYVEEGDTIVIMLGE
nr:penicillin-binding transpeptidase domain-containing protein [uncultured Faecalibacillus sp.]